MLGYLRVNVPPLPLVFLDEKLADFMVLSQAFLLQIGSFVVSSEINVAVELESEKKGQRQRLEY